MSFKQKAFAVGRFFRVLDDDNVVSLTNVALMIVLAKLVMVPSVSVVEVGTLLLGLFNYSYKRYIKFREPKPEELTKRHKSQLGEMEKVVTELRDKVGQISTVLSLRPRR